MAETEHEAARRRLESAAGGDAESWRLLLAGHHDRLRRMVAVRIDPRLQGRLDPSDVLQEAYLEAARQLGDFLDKEDVPFFLWLRGLVGSRLARLHRHHLGARRRDAGREVSLDREPAPDVSSAVLAGCLLGPAERPSEEAVRAELRERLRAVLERLGADDREVVSLRHFEQLSTAETAAVLGISEAAAGKRYVRALTRLRRLLADDPDVLRGWRP
jgi:RNA polymerase sigma-70 factor (ECF subfamily)